MLVLEERFEQHIIPIHNLHIVGATSLYGWPSLVQQPFQPFTHIIYQFLPYLSLVEKYMPSVSHPRIPVQREEAII